jgi:hypothetical protein
MVWAGHIARVGDKRDTNRVFVGRPEGKSAFPRPECRYSDNIKEVGGRSIGCIDMAYGRDRCWAPSNAALNLGVP